MVHTVDKISKRIWKDFGIRINLEEPRQKEAEIRAILLTYHQADLEKIWSNAGKNVDFAKQIEVKR